MDLSAQELNGWLISPEGEWCYQFHRDPKSWKRYPIVLVDKWKTRNDGIPSQMKSRRKLPLDEALELCGHMILDGWKKLADQFGESPEIGFIDEVSS